jgi:sialate O-acetylesterase
VSASDRVHWRPNKDKQPARLEGEELRNYVERRTKGAGLGLPFATEMLRRTGVPVGLVPCAHGGTSMDQWDPALKVKGSDALYGSMLRRFKAVGGRVKGVLWYQGESDANPKAVPEFAAKFDKLVTSIREDFAQPDLQFYYVQIGRHVNNTNANEWNMVQEAQRKAEPVLPRVGMVSAVDLSLDDGIHISTQDLKRLALRLANLATHDLFPNLKEYATLKRGPRPVSARVDGSAVRVAFAEVNGKLRSAGRLSGFSIHATNGDVLPAFFRARVDSQDPNSVLLDLNGKLPEGAVLRYGAGKDPYCNLTDDADMGAPVFGPMAIARP